MKKTVHKNLEFAIPMKPIRKKSIPEEIINQLKQLIDSGHLVPGSRLPPERELARGMNVGRPAIREALGALNLLGVIENHPGNGTFLTSSYKELPSDPFSILFLLDKSTLVEIFNARKIMEGPVAALAAEHRTEEDLKTMETALDGMERELFQIDKFLKYEYQFHRAVTVAAGNKIIADLMEKLYRLLKETRITVYHECASSLTLFQEKDYKNHRLIFDAIKAGNAQEATKAMMNHLLAFEEWLYRQQLKENQKRTK